MARLAFTAAAALLLLACAAEASRIMVDADLAPSGRQLLACAIPNCNTCRNQRVPGSKTSVEVCSVCAAGFRVVRSGATKNRACGECSVRSSATKAAPARWERAPFPAPA